MKEVLKPNGSNHADCDRSILRIPCALFCIHAKVKRFIARRVQWWHKNGAIAALSAFFVELFGNQGLIVLHFVAQRPIKF
jgi:hypothetical protein